MDKSKQNTEWKSKSGTSLAVQWLRLCTLGAQVQYLVGELRFHMLRSVAKKTQNTTKKVNLRKLYILRYHFYKVKKEAQPSKANQYIMYTHTQFYKRWQGKDKHKTEWLLLGRRQGDGIQRSTWLIIFSPLAGWWFHRCLFLSHDLHIYHTYFECILYTHTHTHTQNLACFCQHWYRSPNLIN